VIVTGPASRSNSAEEYRVAVQSDDGLVIDRRYLAAMVELAERAAAILEDSAEVQVALGGDTDEEETAKQCTNLHWSTLSMSGNA
jgi:hypothetical protein